MLHKDAGVGDNHVIHHWVVADEAARLALVVTAGDIGRVCRQLNTKMFWVLSNDSPMEWIGPMGQPGAPGADGANGTNGLDAPTTIGINDQTGTTYTLVLTDKGKAVRMNNAASNTVTVPPNSSVAFDVGETVVIRQVGAGKTSLVAGAGVTLNTTETLSCRKQFSTIGIHKVATDTWDVSGDIEP